MDNFKYKLKELEVGDVEVSGGTKSTVTNIDPETGAISWSIEPAPAFDSTFKKFSQLRDFLQKLSIDKKDDPKFREISKKVNNDFNEFRAHLRNNYPSEYAKFKNLSETLEKELNEISTLASDSGFTSGGEGENYAAPAFGGNVKKKNYSAYSEAGYKKVNEGPGATMGPGPKAGPTGVTKNKYVTDFKYKLVNQKELNKKAKGIIVKPLWEATDTEDFLNGINITDPDRRKFITSRLEGFDTLEEKLNELIPLLQQAKHKTMDYYRANPNSFAVVYGTDLANDYLNDLIDLFKQ